MFRKSLKIVTGGQTGVDRAALDVALELGLPCGGWCPRGRKAEDGPIDRRYPLKETASKDYRVRTERNVRESDGTLVLTWGEPTEGTALTLKVAQKYKKPLLRVDLASGGDVTSVREWLQEKGIDVLNIAGPRESQSPGIYERAAEFLLKLFGPVV